MSTNHYSETALWWNTQQRNTSEPPLLHPPYQPRTWFNNNNNQNDDVVEDEEEQENEEDETNNSSTATAHKEPMFEKPLTPSDVGKLNRLVIPKQHAEKYFPLGAASSSESGGGGECKGLLLSFEDESGKCWRFRYSYWNSSQSYVLTKGWSRYVKDKHLDAGDIVLFERHKVDSQRLFINWRRRRTTGTEVAQVSSSRGYNKNEVGVGWTRGFYTAHPYPAHHHHQLSPYQQHDHCLHAGRGSQRTRVVPVVVGNNSSSSSSISSSSSSKVLRLFGVNMECQPEQCSSSYDNNMPLTTQQQQGSTTDHLYHYHHQPSSNPHPNVLRHQPYYN